MVKLIKINTTVRASLDLALCLCLSPPGAFYLVQTSNQLSAAHESPTP